MKQQWMGKDDQITDAAGAVKILSNEPAATESLTINGAEILM